MKLFLPEPNTSASKVSPESSRAEAAAVFADEVKTAVPRLAVTEASDPDEPKRRNALKV